MKILIACYSSLHRDPRILVQINSLAHLRVVAAGFSKPNNGEKEFIELKEPSQISKSRKLINYAALLMGKTRLIFPNKEEKANSMQLSKHSKYDLIIISDLEIVPVLLASGIDLISSKVIFDAHEYYLDYSQSDGLGRKYAKAVNRIYLNSILNIAQAVVTVSPGLKDLYSKLYSGKIEVIKNLPEFKSIEPAPTHETIRLVHHGAALPKRQLETMIESIDYLGEGYELHFYLLVMDHMRYYLNDLKTLASKSKAKVVFHDTVETSMISKEISQYDLGIYNLPPNNLNSKYALPNKLFEFIQARLGIVIGPSEDMRSIVESLDLGRVSNTFEAQDFATTIRSISKPQIRAFKKNADQAAKQLSTDTSNAQWRNIVTEILDQ